MRLKSLGLWAVVGVFAFLILGIAAEAQTSSVVGTIADPSGAIVEGAKVTQRIRKPAQFGMCFPTKQDYTG